MILAEREEAARKDAKAERRDLLGAFASLRTLPLH